MGTAGRLYDAAQVAKGLYAECLGDDWETLPALVRRLHDEGRGTGRLDVERGRSVLARVLAFLFSLPPPGRAISVTLEVTEREGVETWLRRFEEHELVSSQRALGRGRIAERLGPVECRLLLRACPGGLELQSEGAELWLGPLPLPLPPKIAPWIAARATAQGDAVTLSVEIRAGVAGTLLLRYTGFMQPTGRT